MTARADRSTVWQKRGLLLAPDPAIAWMETHAMLPVPVATADGVALYVTGRNREGCGQVGRCRLRWVGGTPAVEVDTPLPLVPAGPLGAFDDRGVSASAIVESGGRLFLYYSGWSLGVTVPFYVFLGLAISEDGGRTFEKVSPAPILGRTDDDPFSTGHPAVLLEDGLWRMWYVSCSDWRMVDGTPRHYHHVKYAESADGVNWRRENRVCIDHATSDEYSIARPWVMRDSGGYRMWYSYRGAAYRIGYAESRDGLTWERRDGDAGISVSPTGWDSEMVEYPAVVSVDGSEWMFYNGNGFGRSGIGCAARR
jgi:hypothetical protein